MSNITMDTDWGAKGAQLTGAEVQAFIKEQLKALMDADAALRTAVQNIQTTLSEAPSQMTPEELKAFVKETLSSDEISPADIGAAAAEHTHTDASQIPTLEISKINNLQQTLNGLVSTESLNALMGLKDQTYLSKTDAAKNYAPIGAQAVTSVTSLPVDSTLVIAEVTPEDATAQSLGYAAAPQKGREIHCIVHNASATTDLTVAIPTSFVNCGEDASITIGAGKYGEISAVYDGSKFFIRAVGS